MEFLEFIQQISSQRVKARDTVAVSYADSEITGTIVPCTLIISRDGQELNNIIHERDGNLCISVKTMPDGLGPDTGTPILISEITTIDKIG